VGRGREGRGGEGREVGEKGRGRSSPNVRDALTPLSFLLCNSNFVFNVRDALTPLSFLLCNSNFVFQTPPFYDIRLQKCRDLKIGVRGHSTSLKVATFDMFMVSY